jgi:UDP-N-acetylmuramoyl-tripeptide--D-alanyl-D-alanine ligase
MAKEILEGARSEGIPENRLKFVPDAIQAGEFLARTVKAGDIVLVKGSRGVKLEQALDALRAAFTSLEP